MLAGLIPENIYAPMPNWLLWVFLVVALRFLAYGADRLVSGAIRMAGALGISTVIIGATVVSLGTTAPEAFVSVGAAFEGKPGLALGNAVGSIICNTALVFGLCCLIVRLPLDRYILHRQGVLKLAVVGLLIATLFLLAMDNGGFDSVMFPRWVGIAYLVLLVGYMCLSVRWARHCPETIPPRANVGPPEKYRLGEGIVNVLMLGDGLAIVYVTSDLLIGSAGTLCGRYGVPEDVLAVTVIAFGTSVPELVTGLTAIIKGHPGLLIGNVIGANILNVLFVIGAAGTAVPLNVPVTFFYLHLPAMGIVAALMGIYIFTSGKTFRRWQGGLLLLVYVAYYAILLKTHPV